MYQQPRTSCKPFRWLCWLEYFLLGVHSTGNIEQWAGAAFGATFLMSAIVAPIWGRMADLHGRN